MVDELFEALEDIFEFRRKKKKKKPAHYDERPRYQRGEGLQMEHRPSTPPVAPPVFCLQCGTRNEADARFCLECGEILPAAGEEMRCMKCNTVVPLTAKFCGKCGAKVAV